MGVWEVCIRVEITSLTQPYMPLPPIPPPPPLPQPCHTIPLHNIHVLELMMHEGTPFLHHAPPPSLPPHLHTVLRSGLSPQERLQAPLNRMTSFHWGWGPFIITNHGANIRGHVASQLTTQYTEKLQVIRFII